MSYFDKSIQLFLSGKEFHNNLKIHYPLRNSIRYTREQFLIKYCTEKKIIHVGFVDHIPLIEEKIQKKRWLHQQLFEVTKKLAGIDINEEGIQFIKQKFSFDYLFNYDILSQNDLPADLKTEQWDCIILPDILEHVTNPYLFLKAIHNKFGSITEKILICVPNVLSYKNYLHAIWKNEFTNSDHRFVFTPYSLSKILFECGFEVIDIQVLERMSYGRNNIFKRTIKYFLPLMRDSLIIEARFNK